jgi:hypothetical protein
VKIFFNIQLIKKMPELIVLIYLDKKNQKNAKTNSLGRGAIRSASQVT